MKIYIGTDHRGFALKETIKSYLASWQVEFVDCGAEAIKPEDDFVDVAVLVAQKVASDRGARGILLCGSGTGVSIAANKIAGIRAVVGWNKDQVAASVRDDDVNVLALGADFISPDVAEELVKTFMATGFVPEDRFIRRIAKIKELETHA